MFLSITENQNEKRLITNQELKKESVIFSFKGKVTSTPSKYSLQLGENKHIDVPEGKLGSLDYCWAFLNHSCNPNTYIKNEQLIALKDVSSGCELTFNYNTTEYDMATPFQCNCQQKNCQKEIKGFKYLTPSQKKDINSYTAHYLKALIS